MILLRDFLRQKFQFPLIELDKTVQYFRHRKLRKNEYLLRAGDPCTSIAFINRGVMRNFSLQEDGHETVNYMTSSGEFNTVYQSFVSQNPCQESIQAVTDCELSIISREELFRLKGESAIVRDMVDQLVLEGLQCKEERIKAYLTQDAQQRYENLLERQPAIVRYAPMKYIASYLGITRETLSRIRNKSLIQ